MIIGSSSPGSPLPNINVSFAVSFMILQAVHEGLGTCCITTYDEQAVKEILTVPHAMKVVILIGIGFANEEPDPTPRKPIKKIVSYNHW